jgi:hypothetical protein
LDSHHFYYYYCCFLQWTSFEQNLYKYLQWVKMNRIKTKANVNTWKRNTAVSIEVCYSFRKIKKNVFSCLDFLCLKKKELELRLYLSFRLFLRPFRIFLKIIYKNIFSKDMSLRNFKKTQKNLLKPLRLNLLEYAWDERV